ncbi:hypothetical protein HNQ44_002406 [Planomicrobium koreense]|uniref:Uncharacterized protein n=1 Tax=Planococcus koreensis TaxID=112331 RepID=A0A7W8CTC0_9BACL|nr:hypothetical protein [Planococcus koreensis]MBB5180961.1 hypothetical protein [Planococcus koreensis]
MNNRNWLIGFGLLIILIFGGGFLIRLIRDGDFYVAEMIGSILGIMILSIGAFSKKKNSAVKPLGWRSK